MIKITPTLIFLQAVEENEPVKHEERKEQHLIEACSLFWAEINEFQAWRKISIDHDLILLIRRILGHADNHNYFTWTNALNELEEKTYTAMKDEKRISKLGFEEKRYHWSSKIKSVGEGSREMREE